MIFNNIPSAQERANLSKDLYDDLISTIEQHATMSSLTVPEVVGVLEIIKLEIMENAGVEDDDGEDDQ